MEKRRFGKTGMEVSLLGLGGFHLLEVPAVKAEELVNAYLDRGGNYIETAAGYGSGESERKIGRVMKSRRDECVLVSKVNDRTYEGALKQLDETLENLHTDHLDLWLMHGVQGEDDLNNILDGGVKAAETALKDGRIKHVGISMHGQPDYLIKAINDYPFEAVMSTINYYDKFNFPKIEDDLLPLANEKELGIILMKPIGDGYLWRSAEDAFKYAFSRPVSVVVTGFNTMEMLEEDLKYAEEFIPMTTEEEEDLYKNAVELGDYVCRQCGDCAMIDGIPVMEIFKLEGWFDRQMRDGKVDNPAMFALADRLRFWYGNKELAIAEYKKLGIDLSNYKGSSIICPYGIDIDYKLKLAAYKLGEEKIY